MVLKHRFEKKQLEESINLKPKKNHVVIPSPAIYWLGPWGSSVSCSKCGNIDGWTWLLAFLWFWGNLAGRDYRISRKSSKWIGRLTISTMAIQATLPPNLLGVLWGSCARNGSLWWRLARAIVSAMLFHHRSQFREINWELCHVSLCFHPFIFLLNVRMAKSGWNYSKATPAISQTDWLKCFGGASRRNPLKYHRNWRRIPTLSHPQRARRREISIEVLLECS